MAEAMTAEFLQNARKEFDNDPNKTQEKFYALYKLIRRAYYGGPECGHRQANEYLVEFHTYGYSAGNTILFQENIKIAERYKAYA